MKDHELRWAKSVSKYPERYGRLSGMFLALLAEATELGMSPERSTHWKNRIRTIDNPAPLIHNNPTRNDNR